MIRRALVIAAPGPWHTPRFLEGVEKDFINYQRFLHSPTGGAWAAEEIIPVFNATRAALLKTVRRLQADYTLIVFSGHGGTEAASGRPFIEINPLGESVWLDELVTSARQQLVVLDSCRSLVGGLAGLISEQLRLFPSALPRAKARQLFERHLGRCEPGRVVCFSCEHDTTSADMPGGGLFSTTLLDVVQQWAVTPSRFGILPVLPALQNCQQVMQAAACKQHPRIWSSLTTRQHWFPLAVRQAVQVL